MTVIPSGARDRLREHYGKSVDAWFNGLPAALARAARRWRVNLTGYHDAGWASVVAVGQGESGRDVLIKALPETSRYHQERAALMHWSGAPVGRLLGFDDFNQMLLLVSVASTPGGAERPSDHTERVANVLPRLHDAESPPRGAVPLLTNYYSGPVVRRIGVRAEQFGDLLCQQAIRRALQLCDELCRRPAKLAMLHADLYAENVLFDERSQPVFIDPHAKLGSPAFDWAFWSVYYISTGGFAERAAFCREIVPHLYEEMLAWSLTLAVDGGLYYLDVGDERIDYMRALLRSDELAPLIDAGSMP